VNFATATDSAAAIQSALDNAIESAKNSLRLFVVLLAVFVLLALAVIFVAVTRKFKALIPAAALLAVVAFGTVKAGIPVFWPHGIFTGGEIKAVPELSSSPIGNFPPGTPLTILRKSKTWYYVSQDKTIGWVPAELVLLTNSGKAW
jgi:hypothetical protein